ncbi:MAG: YjzC family protein [Candidatus Obscuribacterales bacterium]
MAKKLKPGQTAPASGQYKVVGPKGGDQKVEVTVVKGEPMPPTPKPGMGFELVDKTKHKSDK